MEFLKVKRWGKREADSGDKESLKLIHFKQEQKCF
jgi:hypothetical protein